MTTPWRKLTRDFWQERTRTALVVLAVAIGITGFATVLSTYAVLTRELNQGYLATNPASATLWTDRVEDDLLAGLLSNHGVSQAEARRQVSARMRVGPGEWRTLQLFVVRDYARIRVSTLGPEKGSWPPDTGEILIERDALQVARARIGDSVGVRTERGAEQTLRLTGTVHDVGQAQARMENIVYGYITVGTLARLGEEPYLDQIKIVVAENALDEKHVGAVAASVRKWLETEGHPVRRMEVPGPGKHPHADIMGLLLLVQSAFGLFALALSGILVVNLLTAVMASQIRQVGIMKAVGGTRGQIARIYFGQALLLGTAALVMAVPAGMLGCRVLSRYTAVFLNFDVTSFAVPLWVYLLEAAVGVVVPLLAAAYPVWRASGISVREALADVGVSQSGFGASAFDRGLAGMGGRGRPLLLAIRNNFRRRTRLALTLLTLATGGVFFLSALNVRGSLVRTLDGFFDSMKFDLIVRFAEPYRFEKIERAARRTPGVLGVEGWITSEASLGEPGAPPVDPATVHSPGNAGGPSGEAPGLSFTLVALPAPTTMLAMDIVEGRALGPDDTNALVVNSQLAVKGPQLEVGNEVDLRVGRRPVTFKVVGKAREPFTPATGYIPLGYLRAIERPDRHGQHRPAAPWPGLQRRGVAELGKSQSRSQPGAGGNPCGRQLHQGRTTIRLRPAHGDDLLVPHRDVLHPGRRRRPGTDDHHEPQRPGAAARDGRAAGHRRHPVDGLASRGRRGRLRRPDELDPGRDRGLARQQGPGRRPRTADVQERARLLLRSDGPADLARGFGRPGRRRQLPAGLAGLAMRGARGHRIRVGTRQGGTRCARRQPGSW